MNPTSTFLISITLYLSLALAAPYVLSPSHWAGAHELTHNNTSVKRFDCGSLGTSHSGTSGIHYGDVNLNWGLGTCLSLFSNSQWLRFISFNIYMYIKGDRLHFASPVWIMGSIHTYFRTWHVDTTLYLTACIDLGIWLWRGFWKSILV